MNRNWVYVFYVIRCHSQREVESNLSRYSSLKTDVCYVSFLMYVSDLMCRQQINQITMDRTFKDSFAACYCTQLSKQKPSDSYWPQHWRVLQRTVTTLTLDASFPSRRQHPAAQTHSALDLSTDLLVIL